MDGLPLGAVDQSIPKTSFVIVSGSESGIGELLCEANDLADRVSQRGNSKRSSKRTLPFIQ
jgi:hypothetical protein